MYIKKVLSRLLKISAWTIVLLISSVLIVAALTFGYKLYDSALPYEIRAMKLMNSEEKAKKDFLANREEYQNRPCYKAVFSEQNYCLDRGKAVYVTYSAEKNKPQESVDSMSLTFFSEVAEKHGVKKPFISVYINNLIDSRHSTIRNSEQIVKKSFSGAINNPSSKKNLLLFNEKIKLNEGQWFDYTNEIKKESRYIGENEQYLAFVQNSKIVKRMRYSSPSEAWEHSAYVNFITTDGRLGVRFLFVSDVVLTDGPATILNIADELEEFLDKSKVN